MGEEWRRKTYYKTRVLIDTERILDPQYEDSLLCITGAQLEMLRNLMQYLHRRSTFDSEHHDDYYLAPDSDEWDSIQAIVADLEETLMGCTDITQALEDIAAQVACLCTRNSAQPIYSPVTQDIVNHYVTEGQVRHDNPYPQETVQDDDRCAIAQLTWQGAWEILTEVIQPAQNVAIDVMMPAVMVAIASWVGPAIFSIPSGVALATLWSAIEVFVAGSLQDVANTQWSMKEDIVCAIYEGLLVDAQTAASMARDIINEQSLAPLDKVCLGLLHSPWMMAAAAVAWDGPTAWATANVEELYCIDCEDEIVGNDWWAKKLGGVENTVIIDHPSGPSWEHGCWQGTVPAGQIMCGIIYEVTVKTGTCTLTPMSNAEASCDGDSLFVNTSHELALGVHLALDTLNVDTADVLATLCPGATEKPTSAETNRITGDTEVGAGWKVGWNCTGYVELVATWQIFEGTSPP